MAEKGSFYQAWHCPRGGELITGSKKPGQKGILECTRCHEQFNYYLGRGDVNNPPNVEVSGTCENGQPFRYSAEGLRDPNA